MCASSFERGMTNISYYIKYEYVFIKSYGSDYKIKYMYYIL